MLAFLALGSGALEYLHNLEHQREDANHAPATANDGQPSNRHPLHDDNNCETHAQLHFPVLAGGSVPLLACLGLFVAFLTLLTPEPVSHRPVHDLNCRGPPAC